MILVNESASISVSIRRRDAYKIEICRLTSTVYVKDRCDELQTENGDLELGFCNSNFGSYDLLCLLRITKERLFIIQKQKPKDNKNNNNEYLFI